MLICYGTRPEWIKVKPLIAELRSRNYQLATLFTGQHKDLIKDSNPDIEFEMGGGDNRLDSIFASIAMNFQKFKDVLCKHSSVLVQGDTASALAIALCAFHRQYDIYHLEAGLRSYDIGNPYPEESYRSMISRIANVNFCPTENNAENLRNEKVPGLVIVTGNTGLDNLSNITTTKEDIVLVTLHRRENRDDMKLWFEVISNLASIYFNLEFIVPAHPSIRHYNVLSSDVKVIEPMSHEECIKLIARSCMIITDSGGIQEEACFLRKKTIVCRLVTERQESIGLNAKLVKSAFNLPGIFGAFLLDSYPSYTECPFGDGHASKKVADYICGIR